jgi:hypothetical protein
MHRQVYSAQAELLLRSRGTQLRKLYPSVLLKRGHTNTLHDYQTCELCYAVWSVLV